MHVDGRGDGAGGSGRAVEQLPFLGRSNGRSDWVEIAQGFDHGTR